jgi:hypothetical protein
VRSPSRAEHLPFAAGEISTEAAAIGPSVALGADGGVAPPVPEVVRALRAWTQTPTTTSESRAATVSVKVVAREYVTLCQKFADDFERDHAQLFGARQ